MTSSTTPLSFDDWISTDPDGQEIYRRILHNRHGIWVTDLIASWETLEDGQQRALIYLWELYQQDPGFSHLTRHCVDQQHRLACIVMHVVRQGARSIYLRRIVEQGHPREVGLTFAGEKEDTERVLPGTFEPDHLRPTEDAILPKEVYRPDRKQAVRQAVRAAADKIDPRNPGVRTDVRHVTRTIVQGHMYHYVDQYNQQGTFRAFCEERGVGKNVITRWRPRIFEVLRQELAAYVRD